MYVYALRLTLSLPASLIGGLDTLPNPASSPYVNRYSVMLKIFSVLIVQIWDISKMV